MIITIPPWEYLVQYCTVDREGDLRSKKTGLCVFTTAAERYLHQDRTLETKDAPNTDGEYPVINNPGLHWILPDFLDICREYRIFGTTKTILKRRPHATD